MAFKHLAMTQPFLIKVMTCILPKADNANCDYVSLQSTKNNSVSEDVWSRCILIW